MSLNLRKSIPLNKKFTNKNSTLHIYFENLRDDKDPKNLNINYQMQQLVYNQMFQKLQTLEFWYLFRVCKNSKEKTTKNTQKNRITQKCISMCLYYVA